MKLNQEFIVGTRQCTVIVHYIYVYLPSLYRESFPKQQSITLIWVNINLKDKALENHPYPTYFKYIRYISVTFTSISDHPS